MDLAIQKQKQTLLSPNVILHKRNRRNDGGAVQSAHVNMFQAEVPDSFSLTFDNSGGGVVAQYVIGDPTGLVAAAFGITTKVADSGTIDPAILAQTFQSAPIVIDQINYEVTNSASQFAQPFEIANANIGGKSQKRAINVSEFTRNNQFNSKLQTLETNVIFNQTNCMFLKVGIGETVTLTFRPEATVNV